MSDTTMPHGPNPPGQVAYLSIEQKLLIEARYANVKKDAGVAYLFLILTMIGHNIYLGRIGRAALQLILCFMLIGFVWVFIDLFTLTGTVRERNAAAYNQITLDVMRG